MEKHYIHHWLQAVQYKIYTTIFTPRNYPSLETFFSGLVVVWKKPDQSEEPYFGLVTSLEPVSAGSWDTWESQLFSGLVSDFRTGRRSVAEGILVSPDPIPSTHPGKTYIPARGGFATKLSGLVPYWFRTFGLVTQFWSVHVRHNKIRKHLPELSGLVLDLSDWLELFRTGSLLIEVDPVTCSQKCVSDWCLGLVIVWKTGDQSGRARFGLSDW